MNHIIGTTAMVVGACLGLFLLYGVFVEPMRVGAARFLARHGAVWRLMFGAVAGAVGVVVAYTALPIMRTAAKVPNAPFAALFMAGAGATLAMLGVSVARTRNPRPTPTPQGEAL